MGHHKNSMPNPNQNALELLRRQYATAVARARAAAVAAGLADENTNWGGHFVGHTGLFFRFSPRNDCWVMSILLDNKRNSKRGES